MHRITIYWKIGTQRVHALQVCEHLPICVSLNGEQYVDVTDEQLEHLKEYERQNLLEFRNKKLIETPHGLQPDVSVQLGNRYHD